MSTLNYTTGVQAQKKLGNEVVIASNLINLATLNSGSADTLQVLPIPAGTLVTAVWLKLVTPEGGTLTCEIGDGDDADGWLDAALSSAVDLNTTAGTVRFGAPHYGGGTDTSTGDVYPAAGGKYYASADTIDLLMSANAGDTAVFRVYASCVTLE